MRYSEKAVSASEIFFVSMKKQEDGPMAFPPVFLFDNYLFLDSQGGRFISPLDLLAHSTIGIY